MQELRPCFGFPVRNSADIARIALHLGGSGAAGQPEEARIFRRPMSLGRGGVVALVDQAAVIDTQQIGPGKMTHPKRMRLRVRKRLAGVMEQIQTLGRSGRDDRAQHIESAVRTVIPAFRPAASGEPLRIIRLHHAVVQTIQPVIPHRARLGIIPLGRECPQAFRAIVRHT